MIDLHLHSTASDGEDTPSELIDKSLKLGLKAIALTDHDTVDGVEEFLTYGEDKDIICIPGIELSIRHDPPRNVSANPPHWFCLCRPLLLPQVPALRLKDLALRLA